MGILGLTAPIWIGLVALMLFCAGMIARFTFELLGEIKRLKEGTKRANARLRDALDEVKATTERGAVLKAAITNRRRPR